MSTMSPRYTHELKTVQPHFEAIVSGRKRFEIRKDDRGRGFRVGDFLVLREWDDETSSYTGFEARVCVSWEMPAYAANYDGCDATWSATGGEHYTVEWNGQRIGVAVLRRNAEPDRFDRQPIPPPKTRLETRYRNGRWEKRYKKGWR